MASSKHYEAARLKQELAEGVNSLRSLPGARTSHLCMGSGLSCYVSGRRPRRALFFYFLNERWLSSQPPQVGAILRRLLVFSALSASLRKLFLRIAPMPQQKRTHSTYAPPETGHPPPPWKPNPLRHSRRRTPPLKSPPRSHLALRPSEKFSSQTIESYFSLLRRRAAGEPMQHLTGSRNSGPRIRSQC